MRAVDVSKPQKLQRITALSYGHSRSGKTRFAGSWPRPIFFSDATESGWTTLSNMDRNHLFEPTHSPIVWAIEKAQDMAQATKDVEPLIKRGEVQTVVIDSVTFYSDLVFNMFDSQANGRMDQRQLYGKLGQNLKAIREFVHLLGVNVLWLALANDPSEERPTGGPMLSGQQAAKFAAGCDYMFYHRSFQSAPSSPLQYEIRTRKFGQYAAGGRDEGRLPDPLGYLMAGDTEAAPDVFVPDCSYRTLAESLGLIEPGETPAVVPPTIGNTASAAAAVAAASPALAVPATPTTNKPNLPGTTPPPTKTAAPAPQQRQTR